MNENVDKQLIFLWLKHDHKLMKVISCAVNLISTILLLPLIKIMSIPLHLSTTVICNLDYLLQKYCWTCYNFIQILTSAKCALNWYIYIYTSEN